MEDLQEFSLDSPKFQLFEFFALVVQYLEHLFFCTCGIGSKCLAMCDGKN